MEAINAELQMGATDERWDSLFVRSPLPMAIYDAQTYRLLDVNDAEAVLSGTSRKNFVRLTILVPAQGFDTLPGPSV